jgi:hypothetical protein
MFGFWDNSKKQYFLSLGKNIAARNLNHLDIDIPDFVLPSAVIYYPNSKVIIKEDILHLVESNA